MFTGIVEYRGRIVASQEVAGGRRLRVHVGSIASECALGASVCVSGICLTVTQAEGENLSFDVINETLDKTNLGAKRTGDEVNIERSLRPTDRMDGHFVQGHVDATAIVTRVISTPAEYVIWMRVDESVRPYIIPKGSVALDGVSLTIAAVDGDSFSVALIPTTLEHTTLQLLRAQAVVNVETDILARTIVHQLSRIQSAPSKQNADGSAASSSSGLSYAQLNDSGFA